MWKLNQFTRSNENYSKGFSLLEMVFVISIVCLTVAVAVPVFTNTIEQKKVKRLATEIEQLLSISKSNAISMSENVVVAYMGISEDSSGQQSVKDWSIEAKMSKSKAVVSSIVGNQHQDIVISYSFPGNKTDIEFKDLTGRPTLSGNFKITYHNGDDYVKVVTNSNSGRIYTCSKRGTLGYGICSS
ncbi:hypothetical protein A1OS_10710 [Enterovibrio norvegicus]|uniref:prepilin-type N-terminal cleavage/methylation domain-containing protein n=1 Tax=Enterovibrio norvegicus TaxID=188144 RepID=UPI0003664187|nr:prepilin-type N-terminal cleavage/methylation domain-containing protein [Enterovibrio norvegicus]OEE43569.1 hypothetical protein A1OS_10710 [Enterovibrio norvegicus]